jgi:cytochrome c peroxidase
MSSVPPTIRTSILAIASATLLAACGGGGSSSNAPPIGGNPPAPVPAPPPPPPAPNSQPEVALPNGTQQVALFHTLNYDASQAGQTFQDPDGETLTYQIFVGRAAGPRHMDPPLGVTVSGTRITGTAQTLDTIYVTIVANDPRGSENYDSFAMLVNPNGAPHAVNPASPVLVQIGQAVNIDTTQGGARFSDPEGDPLTYRISQRGLAGMSVTGTQISGRLASIGAVEVTVTAEDPYGASTNDVFLIAAPGPLPGNPTLPLPSYVYEDESLPLPWVFRLSSESQIPLWDTQLDHRTTNAGAALGRVLFHDKRLSITNTVACASCHLREHGFASPNRFDVGGPGVPLTRNSMALANARYNIHLGWFWDMRAGSIQEAARQAITKTEELGNTLPYLEEKLRGTAFYAPLFQAAFGSTDITSERVLRALEEYVQSLISYRSRFDEACSPMDNSPIDCSQVFTAQEMRGKDLFEGGGGVSIQCNLCHAHAAAANEGHANNGIDTVITDPGILNVALNGDGRIGKFRAASLRNIALTAPYMHDGRFATLRDVINHYDHGIKDSVDLDFALRDQFGAARKMNLSEEDKDALEAFLHTLTDDAMIADPKFSDPFQ